MKRLVGLFLMLAGGAATLYGAYHVIKGASGAIIELPGDLSVTALTGGLIGVSAFTVGLIWMRD